MEWVALGVLALAVIAVTVSVVTERLDITPLSEATSTRPPLELPDEITSEDVESLSLGSAVYGYAPQQVDAALDARSDRLAVQERELQERESQERAGRERDVSEKEPHVHPDA